MFLFHKLSSESVYKQNKQVNSSLVGSRWSEETPNKSKYYIWKHLHLHSTYICDDTLPEKLVFLKSLQRSMTYLSKDSSSSARGVFVPHWSDIIELSLRRDLALAWLCGLWWLTVGRKVSPTHGRPIEASAQEDTADLSESNTCQVSLRSWRHMRYAKPSALTANLRWAIVRGTAGLHKEPPGARAQQTCLFCVRQRSYPPTRAARGRGKEREGGTDVL